MSFWNDVKRVSSATLEALNSAVEAAADAAEVMNESAKVLALRARIMRLEKEVERSELVSISRAEISAKRNELILGYDELAKSVGGLDAEEANLKKKRLLAEIHEETCMKLVGGIKESLTGIDSTDFLLPIDEIGKRKLLIIDVDKLLVLLRASDSHGLIGWALKLKESVLERIGLLEKRRKVEFHGEYPSGAKLCCVERYDGRPHGVSRYWYESGVLKTEANFFQGVLCGRSKHWREDGSLMVDVLFSPGKGASEISVLLKDGARVAHAEFSKVSGFADIWLWDGTYAGRAYKHGERFGKYRFMLKIMLKPKVLGALWRARREGFYRQSVECMNDVFERSICFLNELEGMQFRG